MTRPSGEAIAARPPAPPAVWLAARARNALRRPLLIGISGAAVFVAALVALVLIPRQARREALLVAPNPSERPDTAPILAAVARARARLAAADSSLADARALARRAAAPPPPPPADTFPPALVARRDSLRRDLAALDEALARVANAPLPASYRALADVPEVRRDFRTKPLLDSLTEIERERDAFGAVGGVDPMFVALTARATAIGHSLQAIATDQHAEMQRQIAALTPPPPPPAPPPIVVDSATPKARIDSARGDLAGALAVLTQARRTNEALDRRAERARELANVDAPPVALLAAALVLGAIVGFGIALVGELRRPRIATEREAERAAGARVLARIGRAAPPPERSRRRADLEANPLVDLSSEEYRLLYLHLAGSGVSLLMVTVTGSDPALPPVVATNLAAVAAYEARTTLLIDADPGTCAVAPLLHVRSRPGLAEIVAERVSWPEAITPAVVGRDRLVDVIPGGSCAVAPEVEQVTNALARNLGRLARRYDAVVTVTSERYAESGLAGALPIPDVVYCATVGRTALRELSRAVEALREAGARVRGIVLWDTIPPVLPAPEEEAPARRPAPGAGTPTAPATTA